MASSRSAAVARPAGAAGLPPASSVRQRAAPGTQLALRLPPCAAAEAATQGILDFNRSPGRKVGEPDNRASHYWFARYWAEALAAQSDDAELAAHFAPMAQALADGEAAILAELQAAAGNPADTGGYYHGSDDKTVAIMRPSATLNAIFG